MDSGKHRDFTTALRDDAGMNETAAEATEPYPLPYSESRPWLALAVEQALDESGFDLTQLDNPKHDTGAYWAKAMLAGQTALAQIIAYIDELGGLEDAIALAQSNSGASAPSPEMEVAQTGVSDFALWDSAASMVRSMIVDNNADDESDSQEMLSLFDRVSGAVSNVIDYGAAVVDTAINRYGTLDMPVSEMNDVVRATMPEGNFDLGDIGQCAAAAGSMSLGVAAIGGVLTAGVGALAPGAAPALALGTGLATTRDFARNMTLCIEAQRDHVEVGNRFPVIAHARNGQPVRSYMRSRPKRDASGSAGDASDMSSARQQVLAASSNLKDATMNRNPSLADKDALAGPLVFGAHAATPPPHCLTGFSVGLVRLNERTPDGREIHSGGFGVRNLPDGQTLSFKTMFADSPGGHVGSVITGLIDEVTIDDAGMVTGKGWLLDSPEGWATGRLIQSGALRGNSVDLSAEEYRIDFDEASEKVHVDFVKCKLAATTAVATPAMEGLYLELEDPEFDFTRQAEAGSLVASAIGEFSDSTTFAFSDAAVLDRPEVAAAAPPAEWFTAIDDDPYPVRIEAPDADGFMEVHGFVAEFGTPHRGIAQQGRLVTPPHSRTNYAYFATGEVLTASGDFVATGRLVMGGEHADGHLDWRRATAAYDDTARAWADVAIGETDKGIWVHGYVRPGTDPATVAAARASGVSGDWRRIGGNLELIAVLSVNTEGFIKPGHREFHAAGHAVAAFGLGAIQPKWAEAHQSGNLLTPELLADMRAAAEFVAEHRQAQEVAALAEAIGDPQADELARLAEVL